jgi:hypothetical protein
VVEGARLESECTLTGTVGSNPTLSAKTKTDRTHRSSIHISENKLLEDLFLQGFEAEQESSDNPRQRWNQQK